MRLSIVTLAFAFASAAPVAQLVPQTREVDVFSQLYVQAVDLVDTASDDDATGVAGDFDADLDAVASGFFNSVTSTARQTSDVGAASFEAEGLASTSLYIQGDGTALATSAFRVGLDLPDGGVLSFGELVLEVDDVFGGLFAFDRPGDATVSCTLVDDATQAIVFDETLTLDALGTEQVFDASPTLFLGAGTYTLAVVADSSDVESNTQVDGSYAVATYSVIGTVSPAWTSLGSALAGAGGAPSLDGSGEPSAGNAIVVTIDGLPPATTTTLVVGFDLLGAPFRGGTLVPSPDLLIGLPTGAGSVALPAVWPAGVPAGFEIWFQAWTPDASAPKGLSASNALRVVAL